MAVNFNIYNALSATYWNPVQFTTVSEKIAVKQTPITFSNGMYLYLHNFLHHAQDFSFNKKTGMFLTNPKNNTYFLESTTDPNEAANLTEIQSPISIFQNGSACIIQSTAINSNLNSKKVLKVSNQTNFTRSDTININFIPDDNKVTIVNNDNNFLTYTGTGEGNLFFRNKISPPSITQEFNYILDGNKIVLFQPNTNFQNIIIRNPSTKNLILSTFFLKEGFNIPADAIINFTSYNPYSLQKNNSVLDSYIARYKTTPILSETNLTIDTDAFSTSVLAQNYLGLFPVEYPIKNDSDASYLLQIHGLKNYQTPEYTYSTANPLLTSTTSIRRLYNKIYSGTNQNKGYDKVYLGYQASTKQFTFPVNQESFFYFPSTNVRYPIAKSGLIEEGATAGEVPFVSDRISVYKQNYEEITPGVPQPPSITKYDNTWACSWLSGSDTGDKIWLDRYYNAAYYTLNQVLTAKVLVYNDKIYPNKQYTYDVPSSLVLEPGILYKYFRSGIQNSKDFITHLDYDPVNQLGAKVLSITNWLSAPLPDDSNYKNNGVVILNTNPQNFQKTYFNLDGTNNVIFPSKSSLLQNERLTVSIWLNVDDWKNLQGQQVFGNYYDSGFGLINESSLTAPMFTLVNNATLSAYNFNYNLLNLTQVTLPSISNNNYNIIIRLPNFNYWVFDCYNKKGNRYDPNNKITGTVSNIPTINFIDQVEIDSNQNLYFFDKTIKKCIKTDSNGKVISTINLTSYVGINRIEIDLNNNIQVIYGNTSVIDNFNNIWEVVGGNLYKNRQIFANVGITQQITCDASNKIWLAHIQDTISILDTTTGLFTYSERIGKSSTLPLNRCLDEQTFRTMNFLRIPQPSTCNTTLTYQDQLLLVDTKDNLAYIIDSSLNLISRLDLRALLSINDTAIDFRSLGDVSSYQYLRKYGGAVTKNLSWKLKIADPFGNNSKLISLPYDVSTLPPGWHNFSFTFDSLNGVVNYYIDSIKVNYATFTPNSYVIYYNYRSSLNLGAASVINLTLNDLIGIQNSYKFIGKVSDLRMYSKALTQGEIEQLYFSSEFAVPRQDLTWNMEVGNRNLIEEIEYWYKMQMPGNKSKYFNINIHNLNIDNVDIKNIIEEAIRTNISRIAPAQTSLYQINWM